MIVPFLLMVVQVSMRHFTFTIHCHLLYPLIIHTSQSQYTMLMCPILFTLHATSLLRSMLIFTHHTSFLAIILSTSRKLDGWWWADRQFVLICLFVRDVNVLKCVVCSDSQQCYFPNVISVYSLAYFIILLCKYNTKWEDNCNIYHAEWHSFCFIYSFAFSAVLWLLLKFHMLWLNRNPNLKNATIQSYPRHSIRTHSHL